MSEQYVLSGKEALARGAWEAGCRFGSGYPGTPSSEILPALTLLGDCYTEWSVNEKCALEAASGASLTGARCLVTMKHVGLNVAADPLFTLSYTGVRGGIVIVSADDPHMHSSQNEQDNRHFARAAVAVIGDSTFVHSGITGLINIAYNNSPSTVIILDNSTTAMTGGQDHPGTGRTLPGEAGALGELRAANIVLLGAASPLLPLPAEVLEEAIRRTIKPKAVEVNLRAFARGRELAAGAS